jgi:hypothetical protein
MQKPVSTQHSWLTKLGVGCKDRNVEGESELLYQDAKLANDSSTSLTDLVGGTVGIVDGLTVIGFLVGDFVGKRVGGLVGSCVRRNHTNSCINQKCTLHAQ